MVRLGREAPDPRLGDIDLGPVDAADTHLAGIVLDREVYGVTLSANVLAHNNGGGIDLRHAHGSTVSANTFTINPDWSLRIGPKSGRITVTGNNFSNAHIGPATKRDDPATGILLNNTSDVAIVGNVFTGLAGPAITSEGKPKRIVVTSNVFADLPRPDPQSGPPVDLKKADAVKGLNAFQAPQ